MEGYQPPFEITNNILNLVSSVSEKIGMITATANLVARSHLQKTIGFSPFIPL